MKDRQHRADADGIEELGGMPGSGQRSGLRFAVTHDYCDEEIWIVECGAEGMRDAVTQLPALVDRTRSLRRAVAADATGKREFFEELQHSLLVLALVRVDLGVG